MLDQPSAQDASRDASHDYHPESSSDAIPPAPAAGGQDWVRAAEPQRHPRARLAEGLDALRRLARHAPPPRELPGDAPSGPEPPAEELALLREAAALAARLRDGAAAILWRLPDGALAPYAARAAEEGRASPSTAVIPPAPAGLLLAAAARAGMLDVDARSPLWGALAPLRDVFAGERGGAPARLTLLPVSVAGRTAALLAVTDVAGDLAAGDGDAALALAQAAATMAGVTLQGMRLGHAAEAEGRARDAFISLVVHELRSPLTAVKGYAQLLLRQARRLGLPPQVTHAVEAVEQEATRMAEMIGEMHDALRIRRGDLVVHPAPVDLLPLVEHAVTAQRAAFPRHEIAVEAPGGPLVGEWEPQRVEQVVGHLVNNAARYTPSGGGVHVGVSRVADGGQALVMVCVRDSGVGVAEPDRGHIFEYLYRSPEAMRRNLSGLGLGLFLSRSLVERMGGRLWLAETRTGETRTGETRTGESHGSTFCFTLPLVGSGAA